MTEVPDRDDIETRSLLSTIVLTAGVAMTGLCGFVCVATIGIILLGQSPPIREVRVMTPEELAQYKVRRFVKAVAPTRPGFGPQCCAFDVVLENIGPDEQENSRRLLWFPHRFD